MRNYTTAAALAALVLMFNGMPTAEAGEVLDRIVAEKKIRLGVRTDAPPFASLVDGRPQGFTVELCSLIAGAIVDTSKIDSLDGKLVSVDTGDRFKAVQDGKIDVLCGATTATLTRRESVSFTLPIFSTGIGAVVRKDASELTREVLVTGGPATLSQAAVEEVLGGAAIGVRSSTTAAKWLAEGPLSKIEGVTIEEVSDHKDGVAGVSEGRLLAYFADRAILIGVLRSAGATEDLDVSRLPFTHEPYALAIPRGDEDLRLVLDRALSLLYRRGVIYKIYERHFGAPSPQAQLFYRMIALPE